MYDSETVREAIDRAWDEVNRQESLWGVQLHADGTGSPEYKRLATNARKRCDEAAKEEKLTWAHILKEEVFEAFAAKPNSAELEEEIVQVIAVSLSWLRAIKNR